jgi:hypothetical protein
LGKKIRTDEVWRRETHVVPFEAVGALLGDVPGMVVGKPLCDFGEA